MSIEKFYKKHNHPNKTTIDEVRSNWKRDKVVEDFLGTHIMSGVLVSDILINGLDVGPLHPDVKEAFTELMKGKVDSYTELRELVLEKYENSQESVTGLINKIQGQYGENIFRENIGNGAELAPSGSQQGWDIKIPREGFDEHIQVKVCNDSSKVIQHISEVNEKISSGEIQDVEQINFAVNSDIFDEVQSKINDLGMPNKLYDIGTNRSDIRDALEGGIESIKDNSLLDNFFSDLLSATYTSAAIHAASNAFLVWKCSKEKSQAIEDTIYSSVISSGGLATSIGTRAAIAELAAFTELEIVGSLLGPVGLVASIGVGIGTREYLKRIASRKDLLTNLLTDLNYNSIIIDKLASKSKLKKTA